MICGSTFDMGILSGSRTFGCKAEDGEARRLRAAILPIYVSINAPTPHYAIII